MQIMEREKYALKFGLNLQYTYNAKLNWLLKLVKTFAAITLTFLDSSIEIWSKMLKLLSYWHKKIFGESWFLFIIIFFFFISRGSEQISWNINFD